MGVVEAGGAYWGGGMMNLAFKEKDKSVFKLVICIAQWDVLMRRFVVKHAKVVSNGSWWSPITVRTGAGCGQGMVVGAQRSGRRTLIGDGYSMSSLQQTLAAASQSSN